ncbi:MAG TPA: response regulator [Ktedonobacterales bacterium]|jgi:CheY-like chemotaxis protein|nr:response regulator [Ktedonobacterales bacterium]
MRETHDDLNVNESALTAQTGVALLPWHSSPRLAFEQLSFTTTDGALALAEETLAPPAQQIIVIAESDPAMANALQDELRNIAGWQALVVNDAQAARSAIAQARPRVVLLDIELTGVDFYAQVRAQPAGHETHIIFVTSATSYNLHQLGAHEGILLRKPYDPRDLAGIVRALLDA